MILREKIAIRFLCHLFVEIQRIFGLCLALKDYISCFKVVFESIKFLCCYLSTKLRILTLNLTDSMTGWNINGDAVLYFSVFTISHQNLFTWMITRDKSALNLKDAFLYIFSFCIRTLSVFYIYLWISSLWQGCFYFGLLTGTLQYPGYGYMHSSTLASND